MCYSFPLRCGASRPFALRSNSRRPKARQVRLPDCCEKNQTYPNMLWHAVRIDSFVHHGVPDRMTSGHSAKYARFVERTVRFIAPRSVHIQETFTGAVPAATHLGGAMKPNR
jgi:hypothetical protein